MKLVTKFVHLCAVISKGQFGNLCAMLPGFEIGELGAKPLQLFFLFVFPDLSSFSIFLLILQLNLQSIQLLLGPDRGISYRAHRPDLDGVVNSSRFNASP